MAIKSDWTMSLPSSSNLSDDIKTKLKGNSYAIGVWVFMAQNPSITADLLKI